MKIKKQDRLRRQDEIDLCLSKLKTAGASIFCIASNSFHGFLPNLPKVGFVNLVVEGLTVEVLAKKLVELAHA